MIYKVLTAFYTADVVRLRVVSDYVSYCVSYCEVNLMSKRADMWDHFARKVRHHIEDYTVPQYGDAPGDLMDTFTPEDCITQVKKYAARFGRNSRDGQDELDLLKMAHYISEAWRKIHKG